MAQIDEKPTQNHAMHMAVVIKIKFGRFLCERRRGDLGSGPFWKLQHILGT